MHSSSTPAVPVTPPPPAADDAAVEAARRKEIEDAAKRQGRLATLVTGATGDTSAAPVATKRLIGE